LGKAAMLLSRMTGRGGSTLPGRVALAIDPLIVRKLAGQASLGNVVVTGTNGKTTTSRMIAGIAAGAGLRITNNRTGANLIYGVASVYLGACDWLGRVSTDLGVIEVDEATVPAAVRELSPIGVVVTNFFRDQLDRFGELETTVSLVRRGIAGMPEGSFVCVNADDPMAAGLGREAGLKVTYFGVDAPGLESGETVQAADVKNCLRCGSPYEYSAVYYAHLGVYRCPSCGLGRPAPEVALVSVARNDSFQEIEVVTPQGTLDVRLPVPGLYNAYNALAAVACCLSLGFSPAVIAEGLGRYGGSFGRMESIEIDGRRALLALVKNPAGFNEVIRTVLEGAGGKTLLICINDNYADGTDVSWLWDVDFEKLSGPAVARVICSGIRAEDMAVRLKYAGLDTSTITIERDMRKALRMGLDGVPVGGTLYVLPTYTAMLRMREIVHDMGCTRMFWED